MAWQSLTVYEVGSRVQQLLLDSTNTCVVVRFATLRLRHCRCPLHTGQWWRHSARPRRRRLYLPTRSARQQHITHARMTCGAVCAPRQTAARPRNCMERSHYWRHCTARQASSQLPDCSSHTARPRLASGVLVPVVAPPVTPQQDLSRAPRRHGHTQLPGHLRLDRASRLSRSSFSVLVSSHSH